MTDLTYKTDNQIIMLALAELLDHHGGDLYKEIIKRANEQRQHIPFHVRTKTEGPKIDSNIEWNKKGG